MYLLCELSDSHCMDPSFIFYDKVEDARKVHAGELGAVYCGGYEVIDAFKRYYGRDPKTGKKNLYLGYRQELYRKQDDSICVQHLIPISSLNDGQFLVVKHHCWDGCDFQEVGTANTFEAAQRLASHDLNRDIRKISIDFANDIEIDKDNLTIDTGSEWIVWYILKYRKSEPDFYYI